MTDFPFDAVLFDCDGVLVDSEPITNRVLADMLGELGWAISAEETLRIFVGKMVMDEAARIEAHTGVAITPQWLAQFRERRNAALDRELTAIGGAAAAVEALHAALDGRIAVASGADRRKVELQLRKAGMLARFDGRIFSGHEMPRSKPHPDVYLAAARALGVDPRRCAVIEDTVTGARAGVAAGATVFGYCPGGSGGSGRSGGSGGSSNSSSSSSSDGSVNSDVPAHGSAAALRDVGVAHVFASMAQLPALLAGWARV